MIEMDFIKEIGSLQDAIKASIEGQTYKMGRDEVNKVGDIYKKISGRRINLSCSDCIKNALQYLSIWYEKQNVPTTNKVEDKKKKKTI